MEVSEIQVTLNRLDAEWLRGPGVIPGFTAARGRIYFELDRALREEPLERESSLDGPGQARNNDVATAKAAAITLGRPGNKRRVVLRAIIDAGPHGLTAEEAVALTGIEYRTLTPRIGELKRGGYVLALDGVTRPGTHGAQQQVLVPTDTGLREMGYNPAIGQR